MIKKYLFVFLLFLCFDAYGQQQITLSPEAEITILTCGPGEELYASFGHSAFRLNDRTLGYDVVYNYGTFDFKTPNFYIKFAQGKLPYNLGRERFSSFVQTYKHEKRWIKEQVLQLTQAQKQQLFEALEENALPENKAYKYDFFFNNCATKIRDVVKENLGTAVQFSDSHITTDLTFRELIKQNIHYNSWSDFGINIALGSVIDKTANPKEYQFLPEYVFKAFENATISGKPAVKKETLLLSAPKKSGSSNFFISPLFFISLLSIVIIVMTYLDYKNMKRNRWLDFIVFLATGLAGILLFLLWFATNHTATAENYNVLWAFFPNLIIAFFLISPQRKRWIGKYMHFLLLLLAVLVLFWISNTQMFTVVLIPFLIALGTRYFYLSKYYTNYLPR